MTKKLFALQEKRRRHALTYPETHEDHPWDHIVTVKLPVSGEMVLTLPYVEPAGYGRAHFRKSVRRFSR